MFILRLNGRSLWLVRTADLIAGPSWAPDGNRIAYTGYGRGRDGVHIFEFGRNQDGLLDRLPCAPAATSMCQDVDWQRHPRR